LQFSLLQIWPSTLRWNNTQQLLKLQVQQIMLEDQKTFNRKNPLELKFVLFATQLHS